MRLRRSAGREFGRGIGLSEQQVLWKVRVPLALPMIFAGIRTALIEVIASATLAAKMWDHPAEDLAMEFAVLLEGSEAAIFTAKQGGSVIVYTFTDKVYKETLSNDEKAYFTVQ